MSIIKPSFYKQTDSRWAKKHYPTTDGGSPSVGAAGCGPTSVANVINATVRRITPPVVFKYACKHGFMTGNSGMYRSAVLKLLEHYGITQTATVPRSAAGKETLRAYLRKNYWAIAIMGPGTWTRGGHYILAYFVDAKGRVYISDPASSAEERQLNAFDHFWNEQKDASWVIIDPRQYPLAGGEAKKSAAKTYTLYTNNTRANIRQKRTVQSKTVATLGRNKALKVKNLKGGWWEIAAGKYKGKYINESNLSKYKTETRDYITLYNMNVRAGYTTNSQIIGRIEKGRAIRSSRQKGRWAYIPAKKGWVCIKSDTKTYLKRTD